MVLTDRQRTELHAGIYEYLCAQSDPAFAQVAQALQQADPVACATQQQQSTTKSVTTTTKTTILEKKWTAIPRLQKKVLELERIVSQSAKIHAHRVGSDAVSGGGGGRRMLPRLPCHHTLQGHSAVVTCVAVHPVFTVAVSGSEDGTVKVWDHESGEYMRTLKGHTNTVNSVCFSPKGNYLATCSTDLSIKLWDFSSYSCLRTLRGHDHTISAIRFIPSLKVGQTSHGGAAAGESTTQSSTTTGVEAASAGCQHLVSASRDTTVKLWDVETGFCDHTFHDHTDWVRCLAVRPHDGGLWASSGNDTVINIYDPDKTKVVELRGHEHVVEALAFVTEEALLQDTNGKKTRDTKHTQDVRDYLASGSRDRTVRLWKISQASCVAIWKAHENWVRSVLIHPSGNYVLSCADDKTIRVFDIANNRCLRTLEKAHDHFVTSLAMHPTLPILVSGGVDQTVRCWQLD